jgi:hypothetical protein
MTKSTYEKDSLNRKLAIVSAMLLGNSFQRCRTSTRKSSKSQGFNTLLLISPKRCSECKCNFATLFLKAEITCVKIL